MTATNTSAASDEAVRRSRAAVGRSAAERVRAGMVVGLGTGDTAAHFIRALAERVQGGLGGLRCVATSKRSAALGRELGLSVVELDELNPTVEPPPIDITVDGADEIDPGLRLIKGAGGALLFEKLVARASRELCIVGDPAKQVRTLGEKRLLPVEIVAFGARHTLARLLALAGVTSGELRKDPGGGLYATDSGNRIVDLAIAAEAGRIAALDQAIKALPGVVETGFFLSEATVALIGHPDGAVEVCAR